MNCHRIAQPQETFRIYDVDGDGLVSSEDVFYILKMSFEGRLSVSDHGLISFSFLDVFRYTFEISVYPYLTQDESIFAISEQIAGSKVTEPSEPVPKKGLDMEEFKKRWEGAPGLARAIF